jgi:hypothetical protein
MIQNPTPTTFFVLLAGVSTFILIMLLPSLVELKRPKDAGPRMIMDYTFFTLPEIGETIEIGIGEQRFDLTVVQKLASIIAVLPNIEV